MVILAFAADIFFPGNDKTEPTSWLMTLQLMM